jgi:hypothetical protein
MTENVRLTRSRRIAVAGFSGLVSCALLIISAPAGHAAPGGIESEGGATQTTAHSTSGADFALAVSPARLVIGQADIGTTQQITVTNKGTAPMPVVVQKRDFTATASGAMNYQESALYSASAWVSVEPSTFTIPSGQAQAVIATITAPAVTEPGDHQLAIAFIVPSGESSGNIKINRGIAVPVYITVPGEIDTSATISNLAAPGFAVGGPVTITASVHNIGTVHRDFRGAEPLVIDAAGSAAAFPDFTVSRGATRDVSTEWDPPWACVCTATVTFVNADGTVQSTSAQVIVFPLHIVGGVLLVLLLGFLAYRFWRQRYRISVITAATDLNRFGGRPDA